jgi:hypothetical protein
MGVAATPPRQILVATDLSQRAGMSMAVTRASQLSREKGAPSDRTARATGRSRDRSAFDGVICASRQRCPAGDAPVAVRRACRETVNA